VCFFHQGFPLQFDASMQIAPWRYFVGLAINLNQKLVMRGIVILSPYPSGYCMFSSMSGLMA
jgi:hypothetical protein